VKIKFYVFVSFCFSL